MVDHVVGTWPHNKITYRVQGQWNASHVSPCSNYPLDCGPGWGIIEVKLSPVEADLVNLEIPANKVHVGSVIGAGGHFEWFDEFHRWPDNGCHISPLSRNFDGQMETGCLPAPGSAQFGVDSIDLELQITYVHGTDDPVREERITGWVAVEFAVVRDVLTTSCQ